MWGGQDQTPAPGIVSAPPCSGPGPWTWREPILAGAPGNLLLSPRCTWPWATPRSGSLDCRKVAERPIEVSSLPAAGFVMLGRLAQKPGPPDAQPR